MESLQIRSFFYHQVFFCSWEYFKGTVARDFQPLFFSWINPIWTPESYTKRFFNSVSNRNTPNLEDESGIHTGSIYETNRRPKILCYCLFNASLWFLLIQTIVQIAFGFLKHPELRKRDYKVGELAGDCRELRNCGSQILKVRNRSSATFFSLQFRNQFGSPQYCKIVEVRTKIAVAHLW